MSGGLYAYQNDSLCDEVTGVYPDYGLDTDEHREKAIAARILNKLEDKQISEIAYDVFCLIHSYDWYFCGDTCRDDYMADVKAFKKKWGLKKKK